MTNGRATGISSEPAPGTEPRKFYGPVERATFSASPPSSPSRSFFSLCPSLLYLRATFCPFDIQSQSRSSLSLSLSWVSGDYYVVTGSSGRN